MPRKLPKQLIGKTIKPLEIVPKYRHFEANFVYENNDIIAAVSPSDKLMAIDLGLNNLAICVTNGVTKPFIIDRRRLKSIKLNQSTKLT